MRPITLLLIAMLVTFTAQPALAQLRFVPDPRSPSEETILEAGEIWASLQETLAPWGPKSSVRGPDGKVRLDRVLSNVTVRDLAWMIHNRYPPLFAALASRSPAAPAAPADARCTAIDARWPGLVDALEKAGKR